MGITGQVGGATARTLLASGQTIRAIVRNAARAQSRENSEVELALADARDAQALRTAFMGVEGVFVMIPLNFAPEPAFPGTRAIVAALRQALDAARSAKAVYLSSIIRPCVASICVDRVRTAESSTGNLTPSMIPINFHGISPSTTRGTVVSHKPPVPMVVERSVPWLTRGSFPTPRRPPTRPSIA
jgi:hypothetical protein